MYQTIKYFKNHPDHCPAEECLAFCAPLMQREIMVLLFKPLYYCTLYINILSPCSLIFLKPSALCFFAVKMTLQGWLSSLKFSFS